MSLSLKLLSITLIIGRCYSEYTAFTSGREKCFKECTYSSYYGYYYCHVDSDGHWDYCSPHQSKRPLVKTAFTLKNGPCKTACTWSTYYSAYTCDNFWGTKDDYCDTKEFVYLQSYTYKGNKCIGKCEKHEGRSYYWCYDENKKDDYCSPYKFEEYIGEQMMKIREYYSLNRGTCRGQRKSRQRRQFRNYPHVFNSLDSQSAGQMAAYALTLAAAGSIGRLVSEWRQNEAIYHFAYLNPLTPSGPILPLSISAIITNTTLNNTAPRDEVNSIPADAITNIRRMGRNRNRADGNNDEIGHLIAYQNGGPSEVYNFAPQPRSLNRGIVRGVPDQLQSDWRRSEDSVNDWVRRGGWVDETVVVIYDDFLRNTRPVGFGQHILYYYPNNTVRFECEDYYSNDPTAAPNMRDQLP